MKNFYQHKTLNWSTVDCMVANEKDRMTITMKMEFSEMDQTHLPSYLSDNNLLFVCTCAITTRWMLAYFYCSYPKIHAVYRDILLRDVA